jgi:hypothetical protein
VAPDSASVSRRLLFFLNSDTFTVIEGFEIGFLDLESLRWYRELFQSCIAVTAKDDLNQDTAAFITIEKLWEKLNETNRIRVVKRIILESLKLLTR